MAKPVITYRPDRYSDGRYVLFQVTDDVPVEIEVHFDQEYIYKRATELNRQVILDLLFDHNVDSGEHTMAVIEVAKKLAEVILEQTPRSADQSTALRCVREAVIWARQAITLDGYA